MTKFYPFLAFSLLSFSLLSFSLLSFSLLSFSLLFSLLFLPSFSSFSPFLLFSPFLSLFLLFILYVILPLPVRDARLKTVPHPITYATAAITIMVPIQINEKRE
jgi:hypothetical protein